MIRGAAPLCSVRGRVAFARQLPAAASGRFGLASRGGVAALSSSASLAAASHSQLRFAGGGTWVGGLLGSFGMDKVRKTKDEEALREELPDVFEERPVEVDDYIRPEKTYFEQMEDIWDYIISLASPVDKQVDLMRYLHGSCDFSFGTIFFIWGLTVRCITLAPMLYAHRNGLRMARCQHLTSDITNNINRVKNDKQLTTPERRVMTDGYKRMEKAVYKKNGCHKYGSFVTSVGTPVLLTAFMAVRRMAAYEDDLESAGFLWITDLTMPDPTMILPFCCSFLFLMNFEANQSLNRGGRSAMTLYMRWVVRFGAIGFTYYFASQPACLFAYWIGLSTAGMLQPVLLRQQWFRDKFDFPPPPKTAEGHKEQSPLKWVMAKLGREDVAKAAAEAKAEEESRKKAAFENVDDMDVIMDEEEKAATTAKKKKPLPANAKKTSGGRSA